MSIELLKEYLKSIDGLDETNADIIVQPLHECFACVPKIPSSKGQLHFLCVTICSCLFHAYNVVFNNETSTDEVEKKIRPLFGEPPRE